MMIILKQMPVLTEKVHLDFSANFGNYRLAEFSVIFGHLKVNVHLTIVLRAFKFQLQK